MTPRDREGLRRALHRRARELLENGRRLIHDATEAPPAHTEVEDSADMAILDAVATTRLDLLGRDGDLLRLIARALERLRRGTYGRCVDCSADIPTPRLAAVPWAERCEDDQEQHEEEQRLDTPSL